MPEVVDEEIRRLGSGQEKITGKKGGGGDDGVLVATFDLIFNRSLNPHIGSSDLPSLFLKSCGSHSQSDIVFVRFGAKPDADDALDEVFDVIGLRFSDETQKLIDGAVVVGASGENGVSSSSAEPHNATSSPPKNGGGDDSSSSSSSHRKTSTTLKQTNSSSTSSDQDCVFCHDCGQSGHGRSFCPKAICSDCFDEGHLAEVCPLAGFDAVTSMTISNDFQKNFTRDVRDACRSAMAQISRTDSIVNNNREEIALQTSGVTCFSCGQVGHKKMDCPNAGSSNNRPIQCFRCRETGHHIKDCPRESADPVDFCLNCAREGHLALDCDLSVDLSAGHTGRCKIYLGSLNMRPDDEALGEWIRNVIGRDSCITVVVKTNNNGRFAFVELELPLPLESELEELWARVEGQGVAQRMSLKAVGPENLVPSEEWARPARTFMPVLHQLGAIYRFSGIPAGIDREALSSILFNAGLKVSKMEFFSNERSANVIIADANPITQEVARKALNGRCNIDFIRANTHADVNGFGSVTSQSQHEQRFGGPGLLGSFHLPRGAPAPGSYPQSPPTGNTANSFFRESTPANSMSNTQMDSNLSRVIVPAALIAASPSLSPPAQQKTALTPLSQNATMVGVAKTPIWFTKERLEEIRHELGSKLPVVQCAEVPKVFWGTCSHVTDAARFWLVNLIDQRTHSVFRSEEWERFMAMDQQLNRPDNFSKYRKVRPDHKGLCVFRSEDQCMLRGYLAEGELFAIDKGSVVRPDEVEIYWYPSWLKDKNVSMQAIPIKLGDVKRVSAVGGSDALQKIIGRRQIELRMWRKQEFDFAHIVLVEAFIDGKSASASMAEKGIVDLE